MNHTSLSRRKVLQYIGASAGLSFLPSVLSSKPAETTNRHFRYCMNTATIRGHSLGLVKELEVISRAGFSGVEIWMDTLDTYLQKGGTAKELVSRLDDLQLTVESAIGFAPWIVDDETERRNGVEQLKKEMELLANIGCKRTAAPPAGATDKPGLDLRRAAERYRVILEAGDQIGVVPQLELWGFSANLNKLSDVLFVAMESGHPKAKVLLDNYHLYKGGSSLDTLPMMNSTATEIFHMNDHTGIPRETIKDSDRTMPGDGVSPLKKILTTLKNPSKPLILSVEIFNDKYYRMDALTVARTAIKKMQEVTSNI